MPLAHVGELSGLGLMLGIELVVDKQSKEPISPQVVEYIRKSSLEKGLIVVFSGNRLRFGPPLVITQDEVDRALDIIYSILVELKV